MLDIEDLIKHPRFDLTDEELKEAHTTRGTHSPKTQERLDAAYYAQMPEELSVIDEAMARFEAGDENACEDIKPWFTSLSNVKRILCWKHAMRFGSNKLPWARKVNRAFINDMLSTLGVPVSAKTL